MAARWKTAAGASLLFSFLLCSPAGSQESVGTPPDSVQAKSGAVRIGFVDMQRALNDSSVGRQALDTLKAMMEEKRASLQREKELIDQKKEELDKQGLLLNEATRLEREGEIRRLERDHSRRFSDTKEELSREEAKHTAVIRSELLKVVEEIGREEGYTMVLEKQFSAILYAPESIDLTDAVIKRYDSWKGQ